MADSGGTASRSRRSHQRRRHGRLALTWVVVALGATLATLWDAAPTGVAAADAAYRVAYVAAVGASCAFARRWSWPVLAGLATVASVGVGSAAFGASALAVAGAAQFARRRHQPVGAVVGVLSAHALLLLPPMLTFGVPSLVAGLAPMPVVVSALANVRTATRRRVRRGLTVLASSAVLVAVASGIGAVVLQGDANRGVDAAGAGLAAARRGDEQQATVHFESAARSFDDARDVAHAWWMAPARAVPVLGPQVTAVRTLAEEGYRLSRISAETSPTLALDDVTTDDGTFRLSRLAELRSLGRDVVDAMDGAAARLGVLSTDWLVPSLHDAVDRLREEVSRALPEAVLAVEALEIAPTILGEQRPMQYLVLFGNPAEAREMGGFVARTGMLVADRGRLRYSAIADPSAMEPQPITSGATLTADAPAAYRSAHPERYQQNWTDSPDIGTVAEVVTDLYDDRPGAPTVDGVLYVDPYVLAALLDLTGPVTIPGTGHVVDTTNAVDFLLRDQYQSELFDLGTERKELLGEVGEAAFSRLLDGGLPTPRALVERLGPLVEARRLLFSTTDPAAHALLRGVGLRPAIDQGGADTVLVAHGNRRPNKLDAFLSRHIDHRADIARDGMMTATVTVTLTSLAPTSGLAPYQTGEPRAGDVGPFPTNHAMLDVYSGLDETEVLIDGEPTAYSDSPAYGLNQYSIPVAVPAGTTVEVQVRLAGRVDPGACRVTLLPNAGARPDTVSSSIVGPHGQRRITSRALDRPIISGCR